MLCHKLGVSRYDLWKLALQGSGDTAMQLLAVVAQQGAVGRILHQGMFEGVFRVRRRPTLEDKLSTHELRQRFVQRVPQHRRDSADQLVREPSAKRCSDLR